jgi:membrane fusion protein, multidrug efflux system
VLVALGLLVIVGLLAGIKTCQISRLVAYGDRMREAGPPPEVVGSAIAETQGWQRTVTSVGTVTGARSVTVAAEVAGVVSRLHFDSGDVVRADQILVELDAGAERAELASARATLARARQDLRRMRALAEAGAIPRIELDDAATAVATARAAVDAARARVEAKVVRAPFGGSAGIRAVKLGQYLAAGAEITTIASGEQLLVDFTLPQEYVAVAVATRVRIALDPAGARELPGEVAAIDPAIDPATRSVRLRARVTEGEVALRSGMFVTVTVLLPEGDDVVVVPATAIVRAPYGDSVFAIVDKPPDSPGMARTPEGDVVKIARQQFVRLGEMRGDFVAVLEGLAPSTRVVSAGAFKLRNGSPVVIDDRVAPRPALSPRPENR